MTTISLHNAQDHPTREMIKLWHQLELDKEKYGFIQRNRLPEFMFENPELTSAHISYIPTKPYIIYLDVNGQYLSTWGQKFSCGMPEHYKTNQFHDNIPAYWQADIDEEIVINGLQLAKGHTEWWTTATLKFLREQKIPFDVKDAYVFPRYAYPLKKLYDIARKMRTERPDEYKIFKPMIHKFPGFLTMEQNDQPFLIRPNWKHEMIAMSRSNMLRSLLKCEQKPFATIIDGAFFEADHPNKIFDGITYSMQLGKWKVNQSMPRDFFNDSDFLTVGRFSRKVYEWQRAHLPHSVEQ